MENFISKDQLVVGEIYTHVCGEKRNNVFCWGKGDAEYSTEGHRNAFCNRFGGNFQNNLTEATPFEKAWLLEMKRIGKFIPENEFQFSNSCLEYSIY